MEKICETPITRADFERALALGLKTNKTIKELTAKKMAVGQGYLSNIVKVNVVWSDDSTGSFVIKAPALENLAALLNNMDGFDMNIMVQMLPGFHKSECQAYEFLKTCRPCPIPEIFFTREISSDQPGMIIMEDLTGEAGTVPVMKGLNLEQTLEITKTLAHFHAWCLQNTQWHNVLSKENKFHEMMANFEPVAQTVLQQLKEKYQGRLGHLDMDKAMRAMKREKVAEFAASHVGILPSVIVHGDLWSNNILLEKLPDGTAGCRVKAFIDWQISHEGNPMEDFGHLISLSCHSSVMESDLGTVARKYHDVLKGILGEKLTATLEAVQHIMEKAVAAHSLFLLGWLSLMVAEFSKTYPNPKEGEDEMIRRTIAGYELAEKLLF